MNGSESPTGANGAPRSLDVREIPPRGRHELIFERLGELGAGETLRLINDHNPVPLRYQLEAEFPDHYSWVEVETGPEVWAVDITSQARVFDARPVIARGEEPFEGIMAAASATTDGQTLVVYAPFDPVPLKQALADRGFGNTVDQIDEGTWRVRFRRSAEN